MNPKTKKIAPHIPELNLAEGSDMLMEFSQEAQRHLISARNSLLVLETVSKDQEALENVFKTFHTIKGLADFLKLQDIKNLTSETELLLDMTRKNMLIFNSEVIDLIKKSITSVQTLLELLDEQISHGGELESSYHDVSELIKSIQKVTSKKRKSNLRVKDMATALPIVNFEPDMSTCEQLLGQLDPSKNRANLDVELIKKLISDFQKTSNELKVLQSRLQERQRELIKERELAIKLTEQAQSDARAKSEYLANMSHEIRTLINAILGFTDVLKDGTFNDKQKEHLNTIILSGKMLLGIVNDILDFSKVEAGKLKLEQIEFDLHQITDEVFRIIRTRLSGKPISLFFKIHDNVPRFIIGDPTRLKQIFINLVDNAIKFTDQGEIGLDITLDKDATLSDGKYPLRFVVSDTGIGIPEDRKRMIFESFTQVDTATTRIYGGTGLGLTLCKTFVETMGGNIWVESEFGKGSQFIFIVRFEAVPSRVVTTRSSPFADFPDIRIMIVERHEKTTKAFQSVFSSFQLKVLPITASAKQASELLSSLEQKNDPLPNIVFVDTMLPDKEGFMLAYKIRQQERFNQIKLVAVSHDVKVDTSNEYRQAGFDIMLNKPVIKSEVYDVIVQSLGNKEDSRRPLSIDIIDQISCDGIRVLVVEDSLPNQELLKVHLEGLGCVCDYVSNGKEAIDVLRQKEYDMCFMDLQMPVMNGLEATQIIRRELKNSIPIVALTAAEVQEEKERCLHAGMTDYLTKPFGIKELKEKIIKSTKM